MSKVIDTLEKWIYPFKDFVVRHHNDPIMWTAFVIIGLIVFGLTYNALHKD